ncbi:MAG: Gfo/Idh/MocA family oxidoreductase [Planctomycetota bacterium]
MNRWRCGLLGLADEGRVLLEAIVSHPDVELVALGDPEHPSLRETAETHRAQAFEDCRSLLMAAAPQAVFVALPAYQAADYVRTAAEHGIAVFQLAPWAIHFEAASGLVHRFERAGGRHVIARPWQIEPAYDRLRKTPELLGRVYAVEVAVVGTPSARQGWRADVHRAGGGTLFHDAYAPLDILVTLCGLPERVYATAAWVPGPGTPRPYDTEDAMSVVCQYSQDRCATITSCRAADELDWSITLHGAAATARISPRSLRITKLSGERVCETRVRTRNRYSLAVNTFVTSLARPTETLLSASRDHLPTMAVLQAAYLSAKTGYPESPAKFLELTGDAT